MRCIYVYSDVQVCVQGGRLHVHAISVEGVGLRKPEETVHVVCATTGAHMQQTLQWLAYWGVKSNTRKNILYLYCKPIIVQMRPVIIRTSKYISIFLLPYICTESIELPRI